MRDKRLGFEAQPCLQPPPCRALVNPLPSPERDKDGSCGHTRDFALLQPLAKRGVVSPILICLLHVIENTSFAFIDLSQDETRVIGRGRVGIRRVRKLRTLGHVIAQNTFDYLGGSSRARSSSCAKPGKGPEDG